MSVITRTVVAGVASGLLVIAVAVPASATASWCIDDPLVAIQLPNGSTLPVYVTEGVDPAFQGALHSGEITYTATQTSPHNKKNFTVSVTELFPADPVAGPFATGMAVTSAPISADLTTTGRVYGSTQGMSGTPMVVTFQYNSN